MNKIYGIQYFNETFFLSKFIFIAARKEGKNTVCNIPKYINHLYDIMLALILVIRLRSNTRNPLKNTAEAQQIPNTNKNDACLYII